MEPGRQSEIGQGLSLGGRLTVLVLATVIATLLLMGGAFWWIMESIHQAQARDKIAAAAGALRFELSSTENALNGTARRLAINGDVVSAVNLIHNYEDPSNVRSLVFDDEKRTLAGQFSQVALNGDFDLIGAYTINGQLTAFAMRQGDTMQRGYHVYGPNGTDRYLLAGSAGPTEPAQNFTPPPHLLMADSEPATRAGRLVFSDVGDSLIMDITVPILRPRAGGTMQNIGWIRVMRRLNGAFLRDLGRQTGVDMVMRGINDDGIELPTFQSPIPVLTLFTSDQPTYAWKATASFFLGAVAVPLSNDDVRPVVMYLQTSELMAGLTAFRNAAGMVLLIAFLVLMPGMLIFMRRTITQPLNDLMASARQIAGEHWVRPAGIQRTDEIGALAKAFDDMAERVQTRERELREKQHLLDGMVNNAPSLIQVKDVTGRYIMVNARWEEFFGHGKDQVLGHGPDEIMDPKTAQQIRVNDDRVRRTGVPHQFEEELSGPSGTRTFYSIKFPLLNETGTVHAICGISQDISERKAAEERLRLTQKVVDETAEGIMITDGETRIVEVNPAFTMITGFARDEVIGRKPSLMSSGRHDQTFYKDMWNELKSVGQWSGEIWDRRKNGEVYPKWLSISAIYDETGHITHYVGVFSDITKVKETERQLEQLAHYDALTGLPNRLLFQDRLRRALARHRRHGQKGALMFLDLDRFKQVNDTLGHDKGDDLLVEATARLLDCVREDDTVARLGGDEFTVILSELQDETLARDVAQRIIDRLEDPFDLSGHETFISASIGIVLFPGDGDTIEVLTRNADMAMYEAKNHGRATFRFFNEGMNARVVERMALESGLRQAAFDEQLKIFYQPKFDLASRRVVSVEALVRWEHPERGLLTPDKFIPLAEETGQILDIGRWVMNKACRQAKVWRDEHGYHLPVAVNLSARQFAETGLADDIAKALEQSGLDPNLLAVEITESMLMDDMDRAVGTLNRLKRLGLSISIDDFGTGYSSLNQLRRLPVDELKIDQTFVSDIPQSTEDMEIVTAIISMAKSLNLRVVAEGVETFEQFEFLSAKGCDLAQGFLIGKPVESDVLLLFLRDEESGAGLTGPADPTKRPPRTLQ